MTEMNLRIIIPIFKFKFDGADKEFSHEGEYDGAEYNISLKHHGQVSLAYLNGDEEFKSNYETFMEGLDERTRQDNYYSKQRSLFTLPIAEYFLIIKVKQEEPQGYEDIKTSPQIKPIKNCILEALHLHCSNGLYYEKTYHYRFPVEYYENKSSITNPAPFHVRYVMQENDSILKQEEFENCRKTFSSLLKNIYIKSPLKNITYLGYSYHRTSFNLVEVPHKFLIFMVIFELLFKKEKKGNSSQAAIRISKLISKVKSDQKKIQKEFFDNAPDCFCTIRNQIAHGDPNLNTNIVELKYPLLYKYVTEAVIKIVGIPSGKINHTKDYYDEIHRYITSYFNRLPSR